MKLKKLKKDKQQVTQLQILKLTYQKKSFFSKQESTRTKILLNQILKIIFEYNSNNKKIMFLGFPKQFYKTLKNTKHMQIPELINNRIWENQKSNIKKTKQSKNITKFTQKLKKKADLIVINNSANSELLVRKSYLSHTPIIILNKKLQISNKTLDYNFPIQKSTNSNIFFSLLKYILEKKMDLSPKRSCNPK